MRLLYTPRASADGSEDVRRLLRYAVEDTYGVALPPMAKTPEGKPYFPGREDICFSLSHSRRHVLCALGESPVGADIEDARPVSRRLALRFSTPEEREQFEFLELWVLKESRLKLVGGALWGLKDVHFSRTETGILCPDPGVSAAVFRPEEGVFAAVCCSGALPASAERADPEKVYFAY